MQEKKFYNIHENKHGDVWANVGDEHEYDFWHEKIYEVPLEYPHIFKMIYGNFLDYTGTDDQAIMSKKLRDIIDEFVPKGEIEWIHVIVENKDTTLHDAYMPRFIKVPHMFDVLNEELTILTEDGHLMVPKLSSEKTKDKHFIRLLENQLITYVSEDLKKAMQKAKIKGVNFEKEKMVP